MQIRFLMLVISLAVMGSISQSKSTMEDHRGRYCRRYRGRLPQKVLWKVTTEGTAEGNRGRWWGK